MFGNDPQLLQQQQVKTFSIVFGRTQTCILLFWLNTTLQKMFFIFTTYCLAKSRSDRSHAVATTTIGRTAGNSTQWIRHCYCCSSSPSSTSTTGSQWNVKYERFWTASLFGLETKIGCSASLLKFVFYSISLRFLKITPSLNFQVQFSYTKIAIPAVLKKIFNYIYLQFHHNFLSSKVYTI